MNNGDPIFLSHDLNEKVNNFIENCHRLSQSGLDFLHSGNLSLRLNEEFVVIKPSGVSYSEITADNLSLINFKTKQIMKGLKPSSDLEVHITIYENMPNINSVVHTHSHFATAMSVVGKDLPVICSMHADYFGEPIKCLPYLNHRKNNLGVQILEDRVKNACLVGKHGVFCFSGSVEKSIEFAFVVEEISKLYFHAFSIKKDVSSLEQGDVNSLHDYYQNKYGN